MKINSSILSESIQHQLKKIFQVYEEVNEVVLYGSRAKGTHHERSDINLVIRNSKMSRQTLGKLKLEIDDSDVPYLVDLQMEENIKNQKLLEHIQSVEKDFYKKEL